METELKVTGMTCAHCVKSVTEELGNVEGVGNIQIELVPNGISTVKFESAEQIEAAKLQSAIEEAGYELVEAGN